VPNAVLNLLRWEGQQCFPAVPSPLQSGAAGLVDGGDAGGPACLTGSAPPAEHDGQMAGSSGKAVSAAGSPPAEPSSPAGPGPQHSPSGFHGAAAEPWCSESSPEGVAGSPASVKVSFVGKSGGTSPYTVAPCVSPELCLAASQPTSAGTAGCAPGEGDSAGAGVSSCGLQQVRDDASEGRAGPALFQRTASPEEEDSQRAASAEEEDSQRAASAEEEDSQRAASPEEEDSQRAASAEEEEGGEGQEEAVQTAQGESGQDSMEARRQQHRDPPRLPDDSMAAEKLRNPVLGAWVVLPQPQYGTPRISCAAWQPACAGSSPTCGERALGAARVCTLCVSIGSLCVHPTALHLVIRQRGSS
jgi:hypothetical protein